MSAVLTLWVVAPHAYRAVYRDAELRLHRATTAAVADGVGASRRLEFELQACAAALQRARHCNASWAERHWPAHHRAHITAVRLLLVPMQNPVIGD